MTQQTRSVLIQINKEDHAFLRSRRIILSSLGCTLFSDYAAQERVKDALYKEHEQKKEEVLNAVQPQETTQIPEQPQQ